MLSSTVKHLSEIGTVLCNVAKHHSETGMMLSSDVKQQNDLNMLHYLKTIAYICQQIVLNLTL